MRIVTQIIATLVLVLFFSTSSGFQKIFYTLRDDDKAVATIKAHYQQINTIISQAYYTDAHGAVVGSINPTLLELAHQYKIRLVAAFTNYRFDNQAVHHFLQSEWLRHNAINTLLHNCQTYHLAGVQVDFEHINIKDKALFTSFMQELAQAFHRQHYELSIAAITELYNKPPTPYFEKRYEGWSGVYDLAQLAKICDFISLMVYDQHGHASTPGPVAGITWAKKALAVALRKVPPEKLSLGIPTYSNYWKTPAQEISYQLVLAIMQHYHLHKQWNARDKVHFVVFDPYYLYQYIFIEDARSFKEKLQLISQFHLRGISVFRMGTEDPGIWKYL